MSNEEIQAIGFSVAYDLGRSAEVAYEMLRNPYANTFIQGHYLGHMYKLALFAADELHVPVFFIRNIIRLGTGR